MKKLLTLILLISATLPQFSCEKETIVVQQTEAELISLQLQELVKKENIKNVLVFTGVATFDNTEFTAGLGSNFKFDKQFVTTQDVTWNLTYLKKYEVKTRMDIKYLALYF
ncbi:hypothetical protein [Pontibacter sp. H249]|uniref:hypothetical protein n=1 Tax=Pontibacter sp. H249 TaxID=3133420 RepID=UPI0030BE168A